jgi:hypothetical protein
VALSSWADFDAVVALMTAPGAYVEVDPLDRSERSAPIDLERAPVSVPAAASGRPRRPSECLRCGRPPRPGVVRLKRGLCGPCRLDDLTDARSATV